MTTGDRPLSGGAPRIPRNRNVKQGTPSTAASSWTPPESVSDGDGHLVHLGLAPLEWTGVLVADGHEDIEGTLTDACRPLVS